MSIPTPYIGIGIGTIGGTFMFMPIPMFIPHIWGIGGMGTGSGCRYEPPPSEIIDPRRLPVPLTRRSRSRSRSRSRRRTSCCDDEGVPYTEDGRDDPCMFAVPYTLLGREPDGEEPEPEALPTLDCLAMDESEPCLAGAWGCAATGSYTGLAYVEGDSRSGWRRSGRSHCPVAKPPPVTEPSEPNR